MPRARPRAPCAVGLSHEYSSHSSTRNGRWNQSAWSRLAICTFFCRYEIPCGNVVVPIRWKSDAYASIERCRTTSSGALSMSRNQTCWYGGCLPGLSSSRGYTRRNSNGPRIASQRCSFAGTSASFSGGICGPDGRSSGFGTDGIGSWCSTPGSETWNDTEQLKIGCPCWIATTRRTEKLPPSRARSTL